MTSFVEFFAVDFNRDLNPRVDDLESYLNDILEVESRSMSLHDFQYVRHGLKISLKIALEQRFVDNFYYNYCKIQNGDDRIFYYYVDSTSQIAKDTLKVDLTMDTVNSIVDPRDFTEATHISREHEDRFLKPSSWLPMIGGTVARHIDNKSEGIVPDKIKETDNIIEEDQLHPKDWYLIYRSNNTSASDPSSVQVLLTSNYPIKVGNTSAGSSITITPSDLVSGNYYYFLDVDNPEGTFNLSNGVLGTTVNKAIEYNYQQALNVWTCSKVESRILKYLVFKVENNKISYTCGWNRSFITNEQNVGRTPSIYGDTTADTVGTGTYKKIWNTVNFITFTKGNFLRESINDYTSSSQSSEGIKELVEQKRNLNVGPSTLKTLSTIDDVIRTDSRLIKIIKYPYCPVPYTLTDAYNEIYDFGENWSYDIGFLRYNKSNLPVLGNDQIGTIRLNDLKKYIDPDNIGYKINKDLSYESKLKNSDFTSIKLVYDSFVKELKLEDITAYTASDQTECYIGFKPTSTINSKFGFKINVPVRVGKYNQDQDFGNILLVTRNNEETILNNEYINYIKNGYNYDKKANALQIEQAQRQAAVSTTTAALSTLGTILSVALAPSTGGASLAATAALGTSTAASLINTGNQWANVSKTQTNAENAMQAKLAQLEAQSTSTIGTDDVDLMSWYSGNRLHLMTYKTRDELINQFITMFDFTGYIQDKYEVPKVDSRIWYNYIQCTPHIDYQNGTLKQFKEDWLSDLKSRYESGVTVFHHNTIDGHPEWNFERKYENWEKWIVEGVN